MGRISFEHLIGAGEQRYWYGETERFRRLEIDHQFNFGALLDGKVSRPRALLTPCPGPYVRNLTGQADDQRLARTPLFRLCPKSLDARRVR